MKYFFPLCAVLFSASGFSQPDEVDLLKNLLKNAVHDSTRLFLNADLSNMCEEQEILLYATPAIELADKLLENEAVVKNKNLKNKILNKKSLALNNIGIFHRQKPDLIKALKHYEDALKIREEIKDTLGIAESFNNIGDIYGQQGNVSIMLEYYLKGVKIIEQSGDNLSLAAAYNNIGYVYLGQGDFENGLSYYKKCLTIMQRMKPSAESGYILNNIAMIYDQKNDTSLALEYYRNGLKIFEELNHKRGIATVTNNIGSVYYNRKKNVSKGLEYYEKSLVLWQEINDKSNITFTLTSLAGIYYDQKKYDKALQFGSRAFEMARETGFPENIKRAAQQLSLIYKGLHKFKEALEMRELFIQMRDSIMNAETQKSTFKQQTKYEYEKQQVLKDAEHQKELAVAEEEKKKQRIITWSVGIGLFLLVLFSVFIFHRLRVTRKQKLVIEEQKKIVDQKNKLITYSINYAKRIQDSILPPQEELSKCFSDYFIFLRPREIVSGDFYWLSSQNDKTVLAIADCTGHGVPGAFMSMIGNTLLNEIVNEKKTFQPAEILNCLNEGVVQALHRESRSQEDGMDISICLFEKNKITFAGANHSVYVVKNNSLEEIKGDIYSIGSLFGKKNFSFTQKEIISEKNSSIYFSTDGYSDQLGETNKTKFMTKQLQRLFLDIASLPAKEQEEKIRNSFEEWKGNYAQLDDVLVAGIKI